MCPPLPGCDPNYLGTPVPLPPPLHHPLGPQGRGPAGGRRGELGKGEDLLGTMEEREERERYLMVTSLRQDISGSFDMWRMRY